jgi:pyruvate dehydrogenase E2 component (dihydrolipoamide acetyltransferase)
VASEVILPRLGQGMEAGTIVRWLKSEGDPVEKGEPLFELDTDKVTQEVEAEASGVLLKILVAEGEVPVGTPVAYVGEAGEGIPSEAFASDGGTSEEPPAPPPPKAPPDVEPVAALTAEQSERVKASPLARRIARERGIDLAALAGTGPEGRIVAEDVERAAVAPAPKTAPAAAPAGGVERVELSTLRKTIARRLTEAWTVPAFQISMSADMTKSQELRALLVERYPEERPTVTDVLTKVCAIALMRHRAVNATFAGDAIELHPAASIGLAVATDRGLVVPVITGADSRTVAEIAAARADLVGRARDGRLQAEDLEGGTFTISNLGMYGVEQFIAVLNPPQAAILAVGAIEDRPVARPGRAGGAPGSQPGAGGFADGASSSAQVVVRPMMTMTLTCDHRTIDGATAAEFLRAVKDFLEEPGLTL